MEVNLKLVSGENGMEVGSGSHCFLCWGTVSLTHFADIPGNGTVLGKCEVENGETLEEMEVKKTAEVVTPPLLAICRYLKLEVKRGSDFGKVRFCGNCKRVVERLSELCRQLEVVKMKVLEGLRTFEKILETGMQLEEMRVAGDSGQEEGKNFKRKIKQKSAAKLSRAFPKVSILKLEYFRNLTVGDLCEFSALFPPTSSSSSGSSHGSDYPRDQNRICSRKPIQLEKPSMRDELTDPLEQKPILPIQVAVQDRLRHPLGSRLTNSKLARCDLCGKKLLRQSLWQHKKFFCKPGPRLPWYQDKYACDTCGREFSHYPNLARHQRMNSCKPALKLPKCNTSVAPTQTVSSRTAQKKPKRKCDLCGIMVHWSGLARHKHRMHDASFKGKKLKVTCELCGIMMHPTSLLRHQNQMHNPEGASRKKTKCDLCGAMVHFSGIARHKKRMHDLSSEEKRLRVKCDLCGAMVRPTRLTRHKKQWHNLEGASWKETSHQEGATAVNPAIPEILPTPAPPPQSEVKVETPTMHDDNW